MKIFQEENKIMNKAELIAAVAENAELTKKDAEKAVKAFIEVVTDELKKGEKVQGIFQCFTSFELRSFGSCDRHRLTSMRVSSLSCCSLSYLEGTESNNLNFLTFL